MRLQSICHTVHSDVGSRAEYLTDRYLNPAGIKLVIRYFCKRLISMPAMNSREANILQDSNTVLAVTTQTTDKLLNKNTVPAMTTYTRNALL